MDKIINYIKTLSNNEKIQELLIKTIGTILLKQDDSNIFIKENENKIIHIKDWISSVLENNEQWKKPRVLTVDALNDAADKYFEKRNNKIQTIELDETHEKLIADLGDYYLVQMLTPQALDNESKQMQHCIGHGGYDKQLDKKEYQYLSLRDKYNKAHVTIEIWNSHIEQLQGKQNKLPETKYLNGLVHWLKENDYKINLRNYGLIINKKDNKIYSAYNIPENCEIDGDFYLNINMIEIPKSLKVNGSIIFDKISFKSDILKIDYFKDKKIRIHNLLLLLYNGCYDLNLEKYSFVRNIVDDKLYYIYDLPVNCEVNGNLDFNFKNDLDYEISNGLTVHGEVYISNPLIKKIPDNLTVDENLNLSNSKIEKIGKNLVVKGNLNLCYSIIKELPEDLKIGNNLYLRGSKIEKLPDNLTIGSSLYLNDCNNIKKLPNNLIVIEDLVLSYSGIKEIPEDIKIEKDLYLLHSNIEKLPKNLKCKTIYIDIKKINLIKEEMDFEFIQVDFEKYTKRDFFKKYNEIYGSILKWTK